EYEDGEDEEDDKDNDEHEDDEEMKENDYYEHDNEDDYNNNGNDNGKYNDNNNDDDNEHINDAATTPLLGLRGGDAPSNPRTDLGRDLFITLNLQQRYGALPTRDDDEEDSDPTLQQLIVMDFERQRAELEAQDWEEDRRIAERLVELEIALETERQRREALRQEAVRLYEARRVQAQDHVQIAGDVMNLRAEFRAEGVTGEHGSGDNDDADDDKGKEDEDGGDVAILGPDPAYVGGRVLEDEE
ncbi:MAG: hypothetical protein Q9216_005458, partial [Gyalolechia sp. 2 TL-2023]